MLTAQFRNEQGQANANRRNECALVLLRRQHDDGEDQLSRKEHLNEETL